MPPSIIGQWDELRFQQTVACLLENAINFRARKPIQVDLRAFSNPCAWWQKVKALGARQKICSVILNVSVVQSLAKFFVGWGPSFAEGRGGGIDASGTLGRGSAFSVSLPLARLAAN